MCSCLHDVNLVLTLTRFICDIADKLLYPQSKTAMSLEVAAGGRCYHGNVSTKHQLVIAVQNEAPYCIDNKATLFHTHGNENDSI